MSNMKTTDQNQINLGQTQTTEQSFKSESDSILHANKLIEAFESSMESSFDSPVEQANGQLMDEMAFLDLIPANQYFH